MEIALLLLAFALIVMVGIPLFDKTFRTSSWFLAISFLAYAGAIVEYHLSEGMSPSAYMWLVSGSLYLLNSVLYYKRQV